MMAVSLRGYAATTAAALPWASSGVAGKALFAAGITPVQLVQTRLVVAAAALALFLALRAPGLLRLQRWQDACLLVLLGVLLAATQFSYFFAVSKIEVAAAILLQYMAPVFGPGSGNETDILHLGDGEWIAVARDELRDKDWDPLKLYRSSDDGHSWQLQGHVTGRYEYEIPGELTLLTSGDVLLSYGDRSAIRGGTSGVEIKISFWG